MNLILESNYFPSLTYFHLILNASSIYIDIEEPYYKQTYRNRAHILTSQGITYLTVPIEKKGQRSVKTCRISYAEDWVQKHLRTIKTAYGKSPFFEHYYPYIEKVLTKNHEYLHQLNNDILTLCLKFLNAKKNTLTPNNDDLRHLDLRNKISPKKETSITACQEYHQMFGNEFVQDLSILDVLFCEGPLAQDLIKNQIKSNLV